MMSRAQNGDCDRYKRTLTTKAAEEADSVGIATDNFQRKQAGADDES
jgi:hypothetical protein